MNYPAASSGVSIREKSKALRRKRRGIQPKEIKSVDVRGLFPGLDRVSGGEFDY
jgi:hypothetical protein